MIDSGSNQSSGSTNNRSAEQLYQQYDILSANATQALISPLEQSVNYLNNNAVAGIEVDLDNQSIFLLNGYDEQLIEFPKATTTQLGLLSASDKTKIDNLKTVATSGNYSDLSGKPDLSAYATTGTVPNDISRSQVDATFVHSEGGNITNLFYLRQATSLMAGLMTAADKLKLDSLATVASSGSYADLSNKPDLSTYYTKQANVQIESTGIYQKKDNTTFPVAHPDITTTPAILPQRYNTSKIVEMLIAPGNEDSIPSSAIIMQAHSFNNQSCISADCTKVNDQWIITNRKNIVPTYTLIQYIQSSQPGDILNIQKINGINVVAGQYCFINKYSSVINADLKECSVTLNQSIVGNPTITIRTSNNVEYTPQYTYISSKDLIYDTVHFDVPSQSFYLDEYISNIQINANAYSDAASFTAPEVVQILTVDGVANGTNDFIIQNNPFSIQFDQTDDVNLCTCSDYVVEIIFYNGSIIRLDSNSVELQQACGRPGDYWEVTIPQEYSSLLSDKVKAIKCYTQNNGIILAEFGTT